MSRGSRTFQSPGIGFYSRSGDFLIFLMAEWSIFSDLIFSMTFLFSVCLFFAERSLNYLKSRRSSSSSVNSVTNLGSAFFGIFFSIIIDDKLPWHFSCLLYYSVSVVNSDFWNYSNLLLGMLLRHERCDMRILLAWMSTGMPESLISLCFI